jgi:flagellar basal-body rod protein FlgB
MGADLSVDPSFMELFDTTQIGLERALSGAALRQQAIATNLANVNTPGYQRQDVNFQQALQTAFADGSRQMVEEIAPAINVDATAPMRADGSTVDADSEAAAQAENGLQYEAISSVLKTRDAILRSAMGVG